MKKHHYKTLKFHTIFGVSLAAIFIVILIINPNAYLAIAMLFLVTYVIGNGIIHARHNELTRDALLEYGIVALVVVVVLVSLFM